MFRTGSVAVIALNMFHLAFIMNKNIVSYFHQHDLYRVSIPHTMLRCLC